MNALPITQLTQQQKRALARFRSAAAALRASFRLQDIPRRKAALRRFKAALATVSAL